MHGKGSSGQTSVDGRLTCEVEPERAGQTIGLSREVLPVAEIIFRAVEGLHGLRRGQSLVVGPRFSELQTF
jgi:hypothetical protein